MRTLPPWRIVRLAAASLAIAAVVTFVGFWAFLQSIHDPSAVGSVVQRIGTPFLPLVGDPKATQTSETLLRVRIVLGGLLWAAVAFGVLFLRAREREKTCAA